MTQESYRVYDLVGIGLGPFNLGLAALSQPLVDSGELTAAFFDQRPGFTWHPGMLIPGATIQVPFMADLVTMADPTSPYSFLNFLKRHGRIHQFYIRESFYPLRREYSDYCAWVAKQLTTLHWDTRIESVLPAESPIDGERWIVTTSAGQTVGARHVACGVGTTPFIPDSLAGADGEPGVLHSAEFLHHREELLEADSVTIVGSGQSAAEIYRDLIEARSGGEGSRPTNWFTRSPRFFPMEYTKLTLEMTSPDYANYFRTLPMQTRDELNRQQRNLYKGISGELVNDIYDTLYRLRLDGPVATTLRAGVSCTWAPDAEPTDGTTGRHRLALHHAESGTEGVHATDYVVLSTGYRAPRLPSFLTDSVGALNLDEKERLDVAADFSTDPGHSLFILNGEEHTHSLNAPDLGMGSWRNSIILRAITGREVYPIEHDIAFQDFGGSNL